MMQIIGGDKLRGRVEACLEGQRVVCEMVHDADYRWRQVERKGGGLMELVPTRPLASERQSNE